MNQRFSDVLQGLMDNRGLSPRAVSRASARAESTIRQLLHGSIPPSPEIVEDIAPVLQIPKADLLIIAGLTTKPEPRPRKIYRNPEEIGELVSIASQLTDNQFAKLIEFSRTLKSGGGE